MKQIKKAEGFFFQNCFSKELSDFLCSFYGFNQFMAAVRMNGSKFESDLAASYFEFMRENDLLTEDLKDIVSHGSFSYADIEEATLEVLIPELKRYLNSEDPILDILDKMEQSDYVDTSFEETFRILKRVSSELPLSTLSDELQLMDTTKSLCCVGFNDQNTARKLNRMYEKIHDNFSSTLKKQLKDFFHEYLTEGQAKAVWFYLCGPYEPNQLYWAGRRFGSDIEEDVGVCYIIDRAEFEAISLGLRNLTYVDSGRIKRLLEVNLLEGLA